MTQPISLAGRKTGKSPDPPVLAERGKKYMHYVYILKCIDGSYYTGYTTDLSRRLRKTSALAELCPTGVKASK
jgi:hypothetical protein